MALEQYLPSVDPVTDPAAVEGRNLMRDIVGKVRQSGCLWTGAGGACEDRAQEVRRGVEKGTKGHPSP